MKPLEITKLLIFGQNIHKTGIAKQCPKLRIVFQLWHLNIVSQIQYYTKMRNSVQTLPFVHAEHRNAPFDRCFAISWVFYEKTYFFTNKTNTSHRF